jgi:hypothetical protein
MDFDCLIFPTGPSNQFDSGVRFDRSVAGLDYEHYDDSDARQRSGRSAACGRQLQR